MVHCSPLARLARRADTQVEALTQARSPLASSTSLPYKSVGITDSTPPSPVVSGIDNIPCGPGGAGGHAHGSTSPLGTSPRGGGVEALRWSRAGSFPSSPISLSKEGSGSQTPYGNLSLAAATVGAGAPGALTPPGSTKDGLLPSAQVEKVDKKDKGLYPSRVVLTSTLPRTLHQRKR